MVGWLTDKEAATYLTVSVLMSTNRANTCSTGINTHTVQANDLQGRHTHRSTLKTHTLTQVRGLPAKCSAGDFPVGAEERKRKQNERHFYYSELTWIRLDSHQCTEE